MGRYIVGITGASGSIYGKRLVEELAQRNHEIILVFTENGKKVFEYELGIPVQDFILSLQSKSESVKLYDNDDLFAPPASGSYCVDALAIVPSTMTTIGKIAGGIADTLLVRVADVCLKEKRKIVVAPRETPLSTIHLKNMLTLSEAGAVVLPPMPSFYQKPDTIDDLVNNVVGRIMQNMDINNQIYQEWTGGVTK